MDYFGILKKAWNITWKYKALWVLGLFAGVANSATTTGRDLLQQQTDRTSSGGEALAEWFAQSPVNFIVVGLILGGISIVLWVISVAAQGGLVSGVNEAAEGRKPSAGEAWGVGFSKWGRTFMIGFVMGLPVFVVAAVFALLMIVTVGGGAAVGEEAAGAAIAGGLCLILPIFVVVLVAVSLIIAIVYQLALRYGVLDDVTFGQAIKRAWNDLWAKRGAFLMWLVMLLPDVAVGVVMLLFMLPFMLPAIGFIVAEQFVMAAAMFVVMVLVMMLPQAIYSTFVSSAWTIFFRQMTGKEPSTRSMPATPPMYAAPAAPLAGVDAPPPPAAEPFMPAEAPIVDVTPPAEAPIVDVTPPAEEVPPADA